MPSHLHLAPDPDRPSATPGSAASEPIPAGSPIRVVLADDHPLMLRSLRQLLDGEQDVEVVAEARDLASLASHLHGERPDVLVLDLGMVGASPVDAIGQLLERAPATQVVALTMEENPRFAQGALSAGAIGCVMKEHADGELPRAVRAAVRGEQYLSPPLAGRLEALCRSVTDDALSPREVEVLRLIALGHTSVEIARKLSLSPRTVETHRAHIHKKLALATRAQLVRYALRRGLLGEL
ncbi:MAG TPA: response regulator transcription factor [Solirubrobacteraceae bacterium]|jgi:two-component system response regulator NreC|nr:response regulator transcription factor [Solirubrobacteraceae bacterium]